MAMISRIVCCPDMRKRNIVFRLLDFESYVRETGRSIRSGRIIEHAVLLRHKYVFDANSQMILYNALCVYSSTELCKMAE